MLRFARSAGQWHTAVLVYNFCAFALQMPLGLLADRLGGGRYFAAVGCGLVALAYLMPNAALPLAVTAGLGNALYHIGGGLDTLNAGGGKAGALGVFVSPGAFGLFLGALAARGPIPAGIVPALLLLCAAMLLLLCGKTENAPFDPRPEKGSLWALAALFAVVCLRSFGGFLYTFPWKTGPWAWVFVLCVVLGKTLGGFVYDRLGGAWTALGSLALAAGLFCLSDTPAFGCAAVLLFNMSMPVTLRAAADRLPGAKGFSFGLLTFALFLGFLPTYLGLAPAGSRALYAAVCLVSLVLLAPVWRRRT